MKKVVESVENRRVESVENVQNRRPSDVFLALARYRILGEQSGLEEFADLMRTWTEIVRLEAEEDKKSFLDRFRQTPAALMPVSEKDTGAPHPSAAPTPSPEGEGGKTEAPKTDAAARSFATRKRKAIEGIEAARAAGKTMQDIADAAPGLTINQIMDAIAANPLPLPTWALIEKALKKLAKDGAADG